MKQDRSLTHVTAPLGLALLFTAQAHAAAQGQPVTSDDRDVGLAVREIIVGQDTGLGGAPLFTVHGEPGAVYKIFGGYVGSNAPTPPALVGGVTGPIHAPALILPDSLFVPRSGVVGVIPPGGVQELDFVSAVKIPAAAAGFLFEFQVVHLGAAGTVEVSNSQRRRILPAMPSVLTYNPPSVLPDSLNAEWADIEQGDVDGDGDLDVMAAGALGTRLWVNTGTGFQDPTIAVPGVSSATSLEFADFDGDGFLDVAVASLSGNFINVFQNQGIDATGAWLGFTQLAPTALGFPWPLGPAGPSDLEIGDLDGDGLRDIFLACAGDPAAGQRNRMFFQTSAPGGALTFAEVEIFPGDVQVWDDSEDCELFDFDLDGDLDVVIANVDGTLNPATNPFGEGVDYILVNQGGAQGGVEGTFIAPIPNPIPPADDESLDVAVGDLDGNGLMDLYFCNWAQTATPGNFTVPARPVPDRLLTAVVGPSGVTYVDRSALLPDEDPATFSTDAEIYDASGDGELDIVRGLGTLGAATQAGVPPVPFSSLGVQVLFNSGTASTGLRDFVGPIPVSGAESHDVRDLEHGDWRTPMSPGDSSLYFELDIGVALTGVNGQVSTIEQQ